MHIYGKVWPTINTANLYRRKEGFVSKDAKPRPVLNYLLIEVKKTFSLGVQDPSPSGSRCYHNLVAHSSADEVAAQRAYNRFRSNVGKQAEIGLLLAERREASKLVAERLLTLANAAASLKRGNFKAFLKALKVKRKKEHKRHGNWVNPHKWGSYWLEYWFGWAPMLADVHTGLELIQAPYPSGKVRGTATTRDSIVNRTTGSYKEYSVTDVIIRHTYQADVRVINPLLYKANAAGVINPLTIAWEMIPFSFMVDWFIPVRNFLSEPTAFVGLGLSRHCYSRKKVAKSVEIITYGTGYWRNAKYEGVQFVRSNNFVSPKLVWDVPSRLSLTRAATAAALLVTIFSPQR